MENTGLEASTPSTDSRGDRDPGLDGLKLVSTDTPFDSNECRRQLTPAGEAYVGGVGFDARPDVEADAGRPGDLNTPLSRVAGEPTDGRRATGEAGMGGEADA